MVHEKVLAAVIGSYKTVALLVVEPLDRTLRHAPSPAFLSWALQQQSHPSSAPAIYQALKPENACTDAHTLLSYTPLRQRTGGQGRMKEGRGYRPDFSRAGYVEFSGG